MQLIQCGATCRLGTMYIRQCLRWEPMFLGKLGWLGHKLRQHHVHASEEGMHML